MEALQFARLNSPIHRLNPLTKLFVMIVYWATALLTFNIPVLIVLCGLALAVYPLARLPLRVLRLTLSVLAAIFVIFIVMNGFMFYGGKTPLFYLYRWPFTSEGLIFGLAVCLKVLSVVLMIPLVTMTTSLPKLMAGLARLRLPYKFIFTLGMAMRLTPLVMGTYFDIMAAQRLRGHDLAEMNYFQRLLKGYIPLFIPLVLTMLRRSADMDIAIESRGFGAPVQRTYLEDIRPTPLDYMAIGLVLLIFLGVFTYLVQYGGLSLSLVIEAKE